MAVKVVDASAIAALLFDEEKAEDVRDLIRHHYLCAPALFLFELSNVCLTKIRRDISQSDALIEAFHLRGALRIQERPVDHGEVLALARQTGLSAYDASYLWLKRRLRVELVTLDKRLAAATAA